MEENQDDSPTPPKYYAAGTLPEVAATSEVVVKEEAREYVISPPSFWAQPIPTIERRGRGRPPGSRKFQRISSIGNFFFSFFLSFLGWFHSAFILSWFSVEGGNSAETSVLDLTAYYMINLVPGENVVTKLHSIFEEMSPDTVSILSATGQVSIGVFNRFGGTVTYAGLYEILSFSGHGTFTKISNNARSENVMLICSLAAPDGTIFGGVLEKSLVAATTVKIVIAVFKQMGFLRQSKSGNISGSPKIRSDQDSPRIISMSGSA
ncbi:unnamed protein product [Lupinus luteus]|uniref:AT-hook motif nuclear-localized protein n=1 Tax=Lupinus luteus TaxID=3873 RepID=A0AAV1YJA0_LUPLU